MKKILWTLFVVGTMASAPVRADMYAVENIPVDVTAENATQAKEQAVLQAQEKAFYKMLDRLTLASDMESLPVLSNEDVLNLVQDFSVSNEKTSPVRYIASVTVQFNPDAIQTFFQEYKVPYITSVAEKQLIFPMLKEDGQDTFQSLPENNAWYKAWTDVAPLSDLVPLVLPAGDEEDAPFMNQEAFAQESELDIIPLLNKYKVEKALVLEATVNRETASVKVVVRPFQNEKDIFMDLAVTEPINAPLDEVLKRAAERTLYLLEQRWREKTAVRFDNPTSMSVVVPIQNLGQWIAIRGRLDKVKLIKQYLVKAVRKDKAQIELFYAGSLADFAESLKKESLFLDQSDEEKVWRIRELEDVLAEESNPSAPTENTETTTANKAPATVGENTSGIAPMVFEHQMEIASQTQPESLEALDDTLSEEPAATADEETENTSDSKMPADETLAPTEEVTPADAPAVIDEKPLENSEKTGE